MLAAAADPREEAGSQPGRALRRRQGAVRRGHCHRALQLPPHGKQQFGVVECPSGKQHFGVVECLESAADIMLCMVSANVQSWF